LPSQRVVALPSLASRPVRTFHTMTFWWAGEGAPGEELAAERAVAVAGRRRRSAR
jgi:hypothetical protein